MDGKSLSGLAPEVSGEKFTWQGGGFLEPSQINILHTSVPILLFYLSCYSIFLIDFQKTPLKLTFTCINIYLYEN